MRKIFFTSIANFTFSNQKHLIILNSDIAANSVFVSHQQLNTKNPRMTVNTT